MSMRIALAAISAAACVALVPSVLAADASIEGRYFRGEFNRLDVQPSANGKFPFEILGGNDVNGDMCEFAGTLVSIPGTSTRFRVESRDGRCVTDAKIERGSATFEWMRCGVSVHSDHCGRGATLDETYRRRPKSCEPPTVRARFETARRSANALGDLRELLAECRDFMRTQSEDTVITEIAARLAAEHDSLACYALVASIPEGRGVEGLRPRVPTRKVLASCRRALLAGDDVTVRLLPKGVVPKCQNEECVAIDGDGERPPQHRALVVQERKTGRVGVAVVRPGGRVELLGLGKDPAIEGAHGVKLVREFREKATGVYVSTPTVGKTFRFEGDRSVPVKE